MSYKAQTPAAKKNSSIVKRMMPGVTTGADPDLLGSSGTAKVPQIVIRTMGNPKASINLGQLSLCFHPQMPIADKVDNSRRNLIARLIGCVAIIVVFFVERSENTAHPDHVNNCNLSRVLMLFFMFMRF